MRTRQGARTKAWAGWVEIVGRRWTLLPRALEAVSDKLVVQGEGRRRHVACRAESGYRRWQRRGQAQPRYFWGALVLGRRALPALPTAKERMGRSITSPYQASPPPRTPWRLGRRQSTHPYTPDPKARPGRGPALGHTIRMKLSRRLSGWKGASPNTTWNSSKRKSTTASDHTAGPVKVTALVSFTCREQQQKKKAVGGDAGGVDSPAWSGKQRRKQAPCPHLHVGAVVELLPNMVNHPSQDAVLWYRGHGPLAHLQV